MEFCSHLILNITVVAEKCAVKETHQQLSNREKCFRSDNIFNIQKDRWTQLTRRNDQINYSKRAVNIAWRREDRRHNLLLEHLAGLSQAEQLHEVCL